MSVARTAAFIAPMVLLVPDATRAQSGPELRIEPRASVLYDSNIARSSRALAEGRGLHLSDVRFSPGASIGVEMPAGRQKFFLEADLSYDFHRYNDRLNRERLRIDGGVDLAFSRCTSRVSGSFSRKQSDVADLIDAAATVQNAENIATGAIDARCGGPVGLVPTLGLQYSTTKNSQSFRKRADVDATTGRAGIAYVRPSFGDLSLITTLTNVEYPNRLVPDGTGFKQDGYRLWSVGSRFERRIGARLKGSAFVNYTNVSPKGASRSFKGLTAAADLDATVSDALKARLSWVRDVRPSPASVGTYQLSRTLSVDADYAIGQHITLGGGAVLDRRSIEGDEGFLGTRIQSETRRAIYTRLGLHRGQRLSIDLDLRRERRDADVSLFDYTSNRALLTARLGF